MLQAPHLRNPVAQGAAFRGTLRDEIERRRAGGARFSLSEAVALVGPLCAELAQHHARGARILVTPSSILLDWSGAPHLWPDVAASPPTTPLDAACLAPEIQRGEIDARSSVFSIGAILYELLTGECVGPAMRRPTEFDPSLDPSVEGIIGTALIIDNAHRPGDLAALAQALEQFVPGLASNGIATGSVFPVDVSFSMLPSVSSGSPAVPAIPAPPPNVALAVDPYGLTVVQAAAPPVVRRADDPTSRLADLKARLEADPRPRYVVIKDGMDHGPFSAVELLQQLGSHAFVAEHMLRDADTGQEKPVQEWEDFAPFAHHAKLNRDAVAEKQAIERVVVAEAKGTRTKMLFGIAVVALLLAGVGGWYLVKRGARNDAIAVAGDDGINVNLAGGLKGEKKKAGARVGTGPGGIPILSGGMSCEQARARYIEEMTIGQAQKQADLTANQLGQVLNNGSYIVACGTPASMHVNVCAAIQNGRAVGVTVTTDPPSGGIAGCIASKVRGMSFPSNPKLDITTTRF